MGRRALHLAGTGAVSAIPAIIPGPGTTAEVSAALGDLALLTAAQIELVLTIAYLYDRPLADHEARRLDVLMALGVDAGVVKLGRSGVVTLAGEKIPLSEFDAASIDVLAARVNRKLATQVASRLARRRAHVIIGREIPRARDRHRSDLQPVVDPHHRGCRDPLLRARQLRLGSSGIEATSR